MAHVNMPRPRLHFGKNWRFERTVTAVLTAVAVRHVAAIGVSVLVGTGGHGGWGTALPSVYLWEIDLLTAGLVTAFRWIFCKVDFRNVKPESSVLITYS